ncbi:MAG: hypothetical protein AAB587_01905 [Patescibacteria group bacterium]
MKKGKRKRQISDTWVDESQPYLISFPEIYINFGKIKDFDLREAIYKDILEIEGTSMIGPDGSDGIVINHKCGTSRSFQRWIIREIKKVFEKHLATLKK